MRLTALLILAAMLLPICIGPATALPGDLSVQMSLEENDLEAEPTEMSDTVTFHGNVTFQQPFYQYASATIEAYLDKNWTVTVSPSTVSSRGPGTRDYTVAVEVPTTAMGREIADLRVEAVYSTRFGDSQSVLDTATVRVKPWVGYRINSTGTVELLLPQGQTSKLLLPVKNVGNEAEYFSATTPYWYGLRPLGLVVESPSSVLIEAKEEEWLEFEVTARVETVPRSYVFDLVVDAQSLPPGGEDATTDPRSVVAVVMVTGDMPPGSPYEVWSTGEPPNSMPAWETVFGSTEQRHHPDVDASGSHIVFDQRVDGETSIYLGDASGSGSIRLTRGHMDHHPVFSPNGQMIAFSRAPDRIMVINHNGTALLEFGSTMGGVNITDWHPAGDRLLFDSDGDIYELNLKFNSTRILATEPVDQWGAVYSPDGSQVYYISFEAAGRRPEIWSMGSDGTGHRQLTFNDYTERFVSVSPNGQRVAFSLEEHVTSGGIVCVMDPDGSDVRYFTDRTHDVYLLKWHPDGKSLLAEVSPSGTDIHDIQQVDYPWRDAGFQEPDDSDDGGGESGGWDLGVFEAILQPSVCYAIVIAVVVVLGGFGYSRYHANKRAEEIRRLKEAIAHNEMPSPPVEPHEIKHRFMDPI
jgi:Tol biopolymer transport system component